MSLPGSNQDDPPTRRPPDAQASPLSGLRAAAALTVVGVLGASLALSGLARIDTLFPCRTRVLVALVIAAAGLCGLLCWLAVFRLIRPYLATVRPARRWAFAAASGLIGLLFVALYDPARPLVEPYAVAPGGDRLASGRITEGGQTRRATLLTAQPAPTTDESRSRLHSRCQFAVPGLLRQSGGRLDLAFAQPQGGAGVRVQITVERDGRSEVRTTLSMDPAGEPSHARWQAVPVDVPPATTSVRVEVSLGTHGRAVAAEPGLILLAVPRATASLLQPLRFTDWLAYSFLTAVLLWGAAAPSVQRTRPEGDATDTGPTTLRTPAFRPADWGLAAFLALAAFLVVSSAAQRFRPASEAHSWNAWFEGDLTRIYYTVMNHPRIAHVRSNFHPLFSVVSHGAHLAIQRAVTSDPFRASAVLLAGTAAAWSATLYGLLRLRGLRLLDALLFWAVAATSAAAVFWFVVPETFALGSLTLLLPLLLLVLAERRPVGWPWFLLASVASFSMTVTNWLGGIIAALLRFPLRRAAAITALAFGVYLALWPLQREHFRNSTFVTEWPADRAAFTTAASGGVWPAARSFIFHSMVMPAFHETHYPSGEPLLLTQGAAPGSAGICGRIGVALWAVLLAGGAAGLATANGQGRFRLALAVLVLSQLALHLVWGTETFLYAGHFGVLLVLVSAHATLTRARPVALALAAALVVCNLVNNLGQFAEALHFVQPYDFMRDVLGGG